MDSPYVSINLSQSRLIVSWMIAVMIVFRIGSGPVSDVMAKSTAQTLMHSKVMSLMIFISPMQAMAVFTFILCESMMSILVLARSVGAVFVTYRINHGEVPLWEEWQQINQVCFIVCSGDAPGGKVANEHV